MILTCVVPRKVTWFRRHQRERRQRYDMTTRLLGQGFITNTLYLMTLKLAPKRLPSVVRRNHC